MDALDLKHGHSFLNVGSGSGFFSALVAQLVGDKSVHMGIELHVELVEHARARCAEVGLEHIQFKQGNAYDIQLQYSMRFDRIYVGAGASDDLRYLFKLLKPGGVIVGPFACRGQGEQALIKAVLQHDETFTVHEVMAVTFKSFERPRAGAPLSLTGPVWGKDNPHLFPPSFVSVAALLRWAGTQRGNRAYDLPWEIWQENILPRLPCDAFDQAQPL